MANFLYFILALLFYALSLIYFEADTIDNAIYCVVGSIFWLLVSNYFKEEK